MLGLCDRWHKTPDEIDACDAARLMRLLTLEQFSRKPEAGAEPDPYEMAAAAGWPDS